MKKKKSLRVAAMVLVSLGMISGLDSCKPTEKNYKSAYDAAKLKKEKAQTQLNQDADPGSQIMDPDGVRVIKSGDVTIYVTREPLKYFCGQKDGIRHWNVAIAKYSMPTNCQSQVEALSRKGLKAVGVQTPGGKYYVIAASFDNVDDAKAFAADYRSKNNPEIFVGLDGNPLLLEY